MRREKGLLQESKDSVQRVPCPCQQHTFLPFTESHNPNVTLASTLS